MQEKSCGVILERDGRFLLLHYAAGHWDFPKGHVETNESEEETARRELQEETTITKATLVPGFRETYSYYYTFKGETRHKHVVFFLMKTSQEDVLLSKEHQGFAWLTFEEAAQKLTFRNAKDLLRKAKEFLSKSPS